VIAVVMLLTVNLPVLAGLYEEIVLGNDNESNIVVICEEETENEQEIEASEEESYIYEEETYLDEYEEEKEELDYIEIAELGGYIPIMPLYTEIDFSIGGFTVGNGETVKLVAGAFVYGDIIVEAGGTLYIEAGAEINAQVITSGNLTMNGGWIFGNWATYGGGVYVSGGTFTMNDGWIANNWATYGGGVYVSGGNFIMAGGHINDNMSDYGGRSICKWRNLYNGWRAHQRQYV